jgi:hypothetical protein
MQYIVEGTCRIVYDFPSRVPFLRQLTAPVWAKLIAYLTRLQNTRHKLCTCLKVFITFGKDAASGLNVR